MTGLEPFLIAAGASLGTYVTGASAAALFGQILTTFVLTGAQMALGNATKKKRPVRAGVSDAGDKQSIRSSTAPQRRIYGRALVGGAVFFLETKAPYLYQGYLLAAHEIDGIDEVRVGANRVYLDASGNATNVPYNTGATSYLKCSIRNGTAAQAIDPVITADFPTIPSTFRQRGHATVVVKAHYGASRDEHDKIWGQGFNPLFVVRGAKVYDPRKPTHIIDDPTTWEWSATPSLCIADYLRNEYGGDLHYSEIDWETVKAAANRDEESIPLKNGGFEPRYTLNGVIDYDKDPYSVMQAMLASNRGLLVYIDGKLSLFSGGPKDPVATIHEGVILGGFEYRGQKPRKELLNLVRTQFVSSDREYQLANGPLYQRTDLQTLDGQTLQSSLDLPFTISHRTAQRLAKTHLLDTRLGRSLAVKVSLDLLHITAGDIVRVDLENFPVANGLYSVEETSFVDGFTALQFTLAEYSSDIFVWNAANDEQDFTLTVTKAS